MECHIQEMLYLIGDISWEPTLELQTDEVTQKYFYLLNQTEF